MKARTYDTAGNLEIHTGHRAFDSQTSDLAVGNVGAPTQHSWYVRCFSDVGNDLMGPRKGQYEYGEFFRFDMQHFPVMPRHIYKAIEKLARKRTQSLIVYEFYHHSQGRPVIHGYVVTERDPSYQRLGVWVTGPTYKSSGVVHECAKYISEVQ